MSPQSPHEGVLTMTARVGGTQQTRTGAPESKPGAIQNPSCILPQNDVIPCLYHC